MSSHHRPWYKWYPKDFDTDEKVKCLSLHAEIIYRRLLDDEFKVAWGIIMYPGHELFGVEDDEKWVFSKRLRDQAEEVKTRQAAAIKAINTRWEKQKHERNTNVIRTYKKRNTDTDTDITTPLTPLQTKKRKAKKFIPPTLEDVKAYFAEKGYSDMAAERAFNYYEAAGWHDSTGKPVKSWKQKMVGVWFKPENEDTSRRQCVFETGGA